MAGGGPATASPDQTFPLEQRAYRAGDGPARVPRMAMDQVSQQLAGSPRRMGLARADQQRAQRRLQRGRAAIRSTGLIRERRESPRS
jgi:hypothetical protein